MEQLIAAKLPRVEKLMPHRHVAQVRALRVATMRLPDADQRYLRDYGKHVLCEHPAFHLAMRSRFHRARFAGEQVRRSQERDNQQPWRSAPFVLRTTAGRIYGTAVPTDSTVESIAIHVVDAQSPLGEAAVYQALGDVLGVAQPQAPTTAGILVVIPRYDIPESRLNPITDVLMALAADAWDKPIVLGDSSRTPERVHEAVERFNVGGDVVDLPPVEEMDVLTAIGQVPGLTSKRTPGIARPGTDLHGHTPWSFHLKRPDVGRSLPA